MQMSVFLEQDDIAEGFILEHIFLASNALKESVPF